jgi:peroxiredoxin
MKRTIPALVISSMVLLAACSGPQIAEPVPEPTTASPTAPGSTATEIPVLLPPAPEPEPTPAPSPAPHDTVTPTPPADTETKPPANEPETEPALPEVGHPAPDFTLVNPDGTALPLSKLDRPILLNFWNTGCKPCRSEMPYLQEIYETHGDTELFLLTINIGQDPDSVKAFMGENNLRLPVAFDTSAKIAQAYQIQYIPTTFFIDRDGIIQDKHIGAFRDAAAIEKKLETIMPTEAD